MVDGKESPIFEEGPSSRKIFCLMEQSMILRRENIALIVAERNLLSSVGRDLALALLSSRTLGISRHVFGQTTSLPASLFSWMCASELRDKQDFIQSAPMWARATAVSACNGTPERRQRAAVPPFLTATVIACPTAFTVVWLCSWDTWRGWVHPTSQLLVPLLSGFTCSLSNHLLLASCFRPHDLTLSKFSHIW